MLLSFVIVSRAYRSGVGLMAKLLGSFVGAGKGRMGTVLIRVSAGRAEVDRCPLWLSHWREGPVNLRPASGARDQGLARVSGCVALAGAGDI